MALRNKKEIELKRKLLVLRLFQSEGLETINRMFPSYIDFVIESQNRGIENVESELSEKLDQLLFEYI